MPLALGCFAALRGCNSTCVARVCQTLGLECPSDATRFGQLPAATRGVLSKLDGYLLELEFHTRSCKKNHVTLRRNGGGVDFDVLSYAGLFPCCECDAVEVTRLTVTPHDLYNMPGTEFYLDVDFYAEDLGRQVDAMTRYHDYLRSNYEGGVDRFFSPTGALKEFQVRAAVEVEKAVAHRFVKSVDEAASWLEPAVFGGSGVYDLTAEPGSGKTSVLPFKFTEHSVLVVLPTPFDAWSAYCIASGPCQLRLQGLRLGSSRTNVTYTDSYMASAIVLSASEAYDVIMVDECDSGRGVTAYLAEIKVKGTTLIRMSASHARTSAGPGSRSHQVTVSEDMPDVRQGVEPVAAYISSNARGRSLVIAPDATVAMELARYLKNPIMLTSGTPLGELAMRCADQATDGVYVSDDVCARGINLNLDAEFDCMLVSEYGNTRVITKAEGYQRRGRVGRNKPGWYFCPGLVESNRMAPTDMDVVRSNVMRCYSGVLQRGGDGLRVSSTEANALIASAREPYLTLVEWRAVPAKPDSPDGFGFGSDVPLVSSPSASRSSSSSSGGERRVARVPMWVAYFSGYTGGAKPGDKVSAKPGRYERRSSGSPDSPSRELMHAPDKSMVNYRSALGQGGGDPYASRSLAPAPVAYRRRLEVACSPPLMDLTQLTYDLDWPEMLREVLLKDGALPVLIPPVGWRHTSSGGMSRDWVSGLDCMAHGDYTFSEVEFEGVARAWNTLVSRRWVRYTPGLRADQDTYRFEFCVRYFQAFFQNCY